MNDEFLDGRLVNFFIQSGSLLELQSEATLLNEVLSFSSMLLSLNDESTASDIRRKLYDYSMTIASTQDALYDNCEQFESLSNVCGPNIYSIIIVDVYGFVLLKLIEEILKYSFMFYYFTAS